jgi:chaperone protein PapD
MKLNRYPLTLTVGLLGVLCAQQAMAAIALDRTRVILAGGEKAVSMSVVNENKELPYLAQGWLEDAQGKKIDSPLVVLPPVQRIEPGAHSQIQVRALPAAGQLPQDRESLFYFNLREIPPRSDKPNTLQIALQTRIKLFYRPKALLAATASSESPWQEKLTLSRQGGSYVVNNPTPYYVTLVDGSATRDGKGVEGFGALMVEPNGHGTLNVPAAALGDAPVLTYVNDYGGRPKLHFRCAGVTCQVVPEKEK